MPFSPFRSTQDSSSREGAAHGNFYPDALWTEMDFLLTVCNWKQNSSRAVPRLMSLRVGLHTAAAAKLLETSYFILLLSFSAFCRQICAVCFHPWSLQQSFESTPQACTADVIADLKELNID